MDRFFKAYHKKLLPEKYVSQSAFSQARNKIKPEAFIELRDDCVNHFYKNYDYKKWNDLRLLAIDGSEVSLPKTEETINKFNEYTTNFMRKTIVMARVSKVYDVLNKITIDALLVNRKIGEHTLANQHFEYIEPNDLLLFDRGYPSYDLFRNILLKGGHFCARVAIANWKTAKELLETGIKEKIAEIEPGYDIQKRYKAEGVEFKPIKCRFILVELSTGEKEVLITSLLDFDEFPHSLFKDLYHLRWDVEESYKKDKHRLQLENFSGKSFIAIMQDFHANMLMGNITSILTFSLDEQIKKKTGNTKYQYQINMTTALSKVKDTIALIFSTDKIFEILEMLKLMFMTNLLPVRPGRSNERKKQKRKRYYKNYLTL